MITSVTEKQFALIVLIHMFYNIPYHLPQVNFTKNLFRFLNPMINKYQCILK